MGRACLHGKIAGKTKEIHFFHWNLCCFFTFFQTFLCILRKVCTFALLLLDIIYRGKFKLVLFLKPFVCEDRGFFEKGVFRLYIVYLIFLFQARHVVKCCEFFLFYWVFLAYMKDLVVPLQHRKTVFFILSKYFY